MRDGGVSGYESEGGHGEAAAVRVQPRVEVGFAAHDQEGEPLAGRTPAMADPAAGRRLVGSTSLVP